jgi:hypothetical protein
MEDVPRTGETKEMKETILWIIVYLGITIWVAYLLDLIPF